MPCKAKQINGCHKNEGFFSCFWPDCSNWPSRQCFTVTDREDFSSNDHKALGIGHQWNIAFDWSQWISSFPLSLLSSLNLHPTHLKATFKCCGQLAFYYHCTLDQDQGHSLMEPKTFGHAGLLLFILLPNSPAFANVCFESNGRRESQVGTQLKWGMRTMLAAKHHLYLLLLLLYKCPPPEVAFKTSCWVTVNMCEGALLALCQLKSDVSVLLREVAGGAI